MINQYGNQDSSQLSAFRENSAQAVSKGGPGIKYTDSRLQRCQQRSAGSGSLVWSLTFFKSIPVSVGVGLNGIDLLGAMSGGVWGVRLVISRFWDVASGKSEFQGVWVLRTWVWWVPGGLGPAETGCWELWAWILDYPESASWGAEVWVFKNLRGLDSEDPGFWVIW